MQPNKKGDNSGSAECEEKSENDCEKCGRHASQKSKRGLPQKRKAKERGKTGRNRGRAREDLSRENPDVSERNAKGRHHPNGASRNGAGWGPGRKKKQTEKKLSAEFSEHNAGSYIIEEAPGSEDQYSNLGEEDVFGLRK